MRASKKDPEAKARMALILEIQLNNKKRHNKNRKHQEDKEKARLDAAEAARLEDNRMALVRDKNAMSILVAKNLHSIMGGEGSMEDNQEERSPLEKQGGSSKSIMKSAANRVSPMESAAVPARTTKFLDTFVYPHSQVILDMAITLKQEKAFEELTKALMDLFSNMQMVNPKFVLNPLNPNSKEKNITLKGKISSNVTKLGCHIRISGNGNIFSKQKVWDREQGNRKSKKKRSFVILGYTSQWLCCRRYHPRRSLTKSRTIGCITA